MGTPFIPKRYNADGSRNVYCRRCGRIVGVNSTSMNFGSVTSCVVCDAADRGEELSPEVLASLNSVRMPGIGLVPETVFFNPQFAIEQQKTDPITQGEPELKMGALYYLKAFGLKVKQTVRDVVIKSELPSQKLAKEKRRKPIFTRSLEDELKDK